MLIERWFDVRVGAAVDAELLVRNQCVFFRARSKFLDRTYALTKLTLSLHKLGGKLRRALAVYALGPENVVFHEHAVAWVAGPQKRRVGMAFTFHSPSSFNAACSPNKPPIRCPWMKICGICLASGYC